MATAPDSETDATTALELFVVLTTGDTTYDKIADHLPAHLDHQVALERSGTLVAAGPWVVDDGRVTGGMSLIRASSQEQVEAIMHDDPFTATGLFDYEIRRWKLNEGRISLVVDLSAGAGRFE